MGSVGGFARQNWSGAFEVAASPSIIMGIPYRIASCCFEDPMRQSQGQGLLEFDARACLKVGDAFNSLLCSSPGCLELAESTVSLPYSETELLDGLAEPSVITEYSGHKGESDPLARSRRDYQQYIG